MDLDGGQTGPRCWMEVLLLLATEDLVEEQSGQFCFLFFVNIELEADRVPFMFLD